MRLFFSGEIPDEQRARLAEIQARLKAAGADVKWTEPHNLHITLRFLGEVSGKLLHAFEKMGRDVGKLYGGFDISLAGIGTFPPKGPPRVVWVGIEEGKKQISMLASAIDSRLLRQKVKMEEHEFRAHVTLGRIKSPRLSEAFLTAMAAEAPQLFPWHFTGFELKESQLTKSGPTYKTVRHFSLAPKERIIHDTEPQRWSHKTPAAPPAPSV